MLDKEVLFICPICKSGKVQRLKGSDKNVICNNCRTVFKYNRKADLYSVKKIVDKKFKEAYKELQTRFKDEKGLKAFEWDRIAKGGMSDKEQKKHDEEQALIVEQKEELESLKKIQKGDLSEVEPIANPPILLKKNEVAYVLLKGIALYEERTKQQYVGGSRGVSFRVMKGVSFRVGAFKGERIPVTEKKHIDTGDLTITNKRVIFTGDTKSLSYPVSKIINVEDYSDGISINREGKQRIEYFLGETDIKIFKHFSLWTYIRTIIEGIYANT